MYVLDHIQYLKQFALLCGFLSTLITVTLSNAFKSVT